jgi:predicted porin
MTDVVQLETRPVEGLGAKLSLVSFHDEEPRNRFDGTLLPDPAADASAWSVGVTWTRRPLRVFAEYVGADDWDNVEGYDLALYECGLWLDVTERFGFGLMYDHARAKGQGAAGSDAEITSLIAGIGFTFEKDVKAYLEYVHQEESSAAERAESVQLGVHWWF